MHIMRSFNGTGATVYLGLGFIPDWVKVYNHEITAPTFLEWNRGMRTLGPAGWITAHDSGGATIVRCAAGAGIAPFYGTRLTANSTAYLRPHAIRDFRGQGTLGFIDTWTLGHAANRTGSVNAGLQTTYVGVGSIVAIKETLTGITKKAAITGLTNDGDAANEITLSESIKSGEVLFVGPMFDLTGGSAGDKVPEGVMIALNTFNVANDFMTIEAGTYDD